MINRVVLVGRLTRDPELKYTQSGIAVVRFTLAVNRTFKNQQGEQEADFINCVAWRKQAENTANYLRKGSLAGIDGRIQTSSFDGKDGNRVFMTEVVADSVQFLEPKREGGQAKSPAQNYNQTAQQYSQAPNNFGGQGQFNQNAQPPQYNNQQQNGPTIVVDDSDLPF